MGYTAQLQQLLSPLGVYDLGESSVSGAMVTALGEALDALRQELDGTLADSFAQSAGATAMALWEQLLPLHYHPPTLAQRQAMANFYLTRPEIDCFAASVLAALNACGLTGTVDAVTEAPKIAITLPQTNLSEADVARIKQFVANFVPAHRKISWHTAQ